MCICVCIAACTFAYKHFHKSPDVRAPLISKSSKMILVRGTDLLQHLMRFLSEPGLVV